MSWVYDMNKIYGGNPPKPGPGNHVDYDPETKLGENVKAEHVNYLELAVKEIQIALDEGNFMPDSLTLIENDPQYGNFSGLGVRWVEHSSNYTDQYGIYLYNPIANGSGTLYGIYIENGYNSGIYSASHNNYFYDISTNLIPSLNEFKLQYDNLNSDAYLKTDTNYLFSVSQPSGVFNSLFQVKNSAVPLFDIRDNGDIWFNTIWITNDAHIKSTMASAFFHSIMEFDVEMTQFNNENGSAILTISDNAANIYTSLSMHDDGYIQFNDDITKAIGYTSQYGAMYINSDNTPILFNALTTNNLPGMVFETNVINTITNPPSYNPGVFLWTYNKMQNIMARLDWVGLEITECITAKAFAVRDESDGNVKEGVSGSFTTDDGKTVTVLNGIITDIS